MSPADEIIEKSFSHAERSGPLYRAWDEAGLFRADPDKPGKPFSIVIPPPNVTGSLHMGHALDNTLQDMLVRYHRMRGDNTLWVPGTDHAGIATQAVVERHLKTLGLSRIELGREKFLEKVWEWKNEFGGKITEQLKRLGASLDWSRERFTMDPGLSRAVREVFVSLWEEDAIYRGNYVVNWCPNCQTAISDIEVEREDRDDFLYHVSYPGVDGGPSITVATTRPETMFGDSAVAVHPDDKRHPSGDFSVSLPLTDRIIPVIRDPWVDPEFGTGALKVTPAHDANDWRIGERHGLPKIVAIDKNAKLTAEAGPYEGLDRFEARERVKEDLDKLGLLVKVEPLLHAVGTCYRCKTPIEPLMSLQWFVRAKPLAEKAVESVKKGEIKIIPDTWETTFFNWMNDIRDWCVSRQLWWGHQIPAFHCDSCGETVVAREDPDRCPRCGGNLTRDPDVLDTWFSSALWPFSTLGWPDKTKDLEKWYPTSALVTGFDILFFWVARMMMMGLKMTGKVPFGKVILHPLVRDAQGQKMSKSKGNVIDPLSLIDEHGADALRFALCAQAGAARDLKISKDRVAGYARFSNKLWNACRFALSHLVPARAANPAGDSNADAPPIRPPTSLPDRWIRSRLARVAGECAAAMEEFRFDRYADLVYHFVWDELCDWYLELAKPVLGIPGESSPGSGNASDPAPADETERRETLDNLELVFRETLALLHPVMPFVTEELHGKFPGSEGFLMTRPFPLERPGEFDPTAEGEMASLMDMVKGVRSVRADFGIPPAAKVRPKVKAFGREIKALVEKYAPRIEKLMGAQSVELAEDAEDKPGDAAGLIHDWGEVWVPLAGEINLEAEKKRLAKEAEKLKKEIERSKAKLGNPEYAEKAPPEVVEETRERLEAFESRLGTVERSLALAEKLLKA
jgi:valyl-tRNA synthetase